MDYGTRAKENFLNGYNCCQAVFLACTDELGLDTETRAKIASSFGGGMGGMRQVCGALSGMQAFSIVGAVLLSVAVLRPQLAVNKKFS